MPDLDSLVHQFLHRGLEHLKGANGAATLLLWATVLLAGIVTYIKTNPQTWSVRDFLRHLFPSVIFTSTSARADFMFWLSRRIFMPLLVLPLAISTIAAGKFAFWVLTLIFGAPGERVGDAGPGILIAFTVTMLLAYDLSYYLYHRLQHQVPLLWELHKVHHSAEVMIGVTKDRVHPIDELMNRWWDGLIPGLCYGIWLYFVLDPVEVTVFGLNVYMLRNTILMMDFVRHTHLKFSFGKHLDMVLLSPHYHQLHHSVAEKHWDKNFGLGLSVWDRIFGTLVIPEKNEDFVFGLADGEADEYQSLYRLHVVPLKKIAGRLYAVRPRRRATPQSNPHHAGETV